MSKLKKQPKGAIGSVSDSHRAARGLIKDVPEIHLILLRLIKGGMRDVA